MSIKEIRKYLPLILPYLIIKWRQAELVIELSKIIIPTEKYKRLSFKEREEIYSWEDVLTMESIYQECFLLNKKGTNISKDSSNDIL